MKWLIKAFLMFPLILFAQKTVCYIGEVQSQIPGEEKEVEYGLLFLKRTSFEEKKEVTDQWLLYANDGELIEWEQVSHVQEDLHEITLSGEKGVIAGKGELEGYPWHWTVLREKMELSTESPIEVEIESQIEEKSIRSIAYVYSIEEDGSRTFFAMFRAILHEVDSRVVVDFLKTSQRGLFSDLFGR